MDESWKEISEDGVIYYVNDEVGTVVRTADGKYISLYPKVLKFGMFDTLEQAKTVYQNLDGINTLLEQYNENLVKLSVNK